jgi:hypothetical protein
VLLGVLLFLLISHKNGTVGLIHLTNIQHYSIQAVSYERNISL